MTVQGGDEEGLDQAEGVELGEGISNLQDLMTCEMWPPGRRCSRSRVRGC